MASIIAFIFSPIGRYIAVFLIVIAAIGGIYIKGHSDGSANVQAKWDSAVQAAINRGTEARSSAESSVDGESDDWMRNDKFNRNKGSM